MTLLPIEEINDFTLETYKILENEYIEINNEIVMPDYSNFLKEHDLQSLDDGTYSKNINIKEIVNLKLEVFKIFGHMAKGIKLYNNKIIYYKITCTSGEFQFWKFSIDDFLDDYYEQVKLKNTYKNQLQKAIKFLKFIALILSLIITLTIQENYKFIYDYPYLNVFIVFCITLIIAYLIDLYFKLPFIKEEKIIKNYKNRLKQIKEYLDNQKS